MTSGEAKADPATRSSCTENPMRWRRRKCAFFEYSEKPPMPILKFVGFPVRWNCELRAHTKRVWPRAGGSYTDSKLSVDNRQLLPYRRNTSDGNQVEASQERGRGSDSPCRKAWLARLGWWTSCLGKDLLPVRQESGVPLWRALHCRNLEHAEGPGEPRKADKARGRQLHTAPAGEHEARPRQK